eukprot:TRINITY_DN7408_c0_g2_i1.p1 TRINITY_DN7408_c0_g2~~TRINITY_DN7408_c0_g2_i1.p1  ORF type:complete len:1458 (-),score=449.59 TRINITY_DN7408_c0_g2_i1:88-4386(-)
MAGASASVARAVACAGLVAVLDGKDTPDVFKAVQAAAGEGALPEVLAGTTAAAVAALKPTASAAAARTCGLEAAEAEGATPAEAKAMVKAARAAASAGKSPGEISKAVELTGANVSASAIAAVVSSCAVSASQAPTPAPTSSEPPVEVSMGDLEKVVAAAVVSAGGTMEEAKAVAPVTAKASLDGESAAEIAKAIKAQRPSLAPDLVAAAVAAVIGATRASMAGPSEAIDAGVVAICTSAAGATPLATLQVLAKVMPASQDDASSLQKQALMLANIGGASPGAAPPSIAAIAAAITCAEAVKTLPPEETRKLGAEAATAAAATTPQPEKSPMDIMNAPVVGAKSQGRPEQAETAAAVAAAVLSGATAAQAKAVATTASDATALMKASGASPKVTALAASAMAAMAPLLTDVPLSGDAIARMGAAGAQAVAAGATVEEVAAAASKAIASTAMSPACLSAAATAATNANASKVTAAAVAIVAAKAAASGSSTADVVAAAQAEAEGADMPSPAIAAVATSALVAAHGLDCKNAAGFAEAAAQGVRQGASPQDATTVVLEANKPNSTAVAKAAAALAASASTAAGDGNKACAAGAAARASSVMVASGAPQETAAVAAANAVQALRQDKPIKDVLQMVQEKSPTKVDPQAVLEAVVVLAACESKASAQEAQLAGARAKAALSKGVPLDEAAEESVTAAVQTSAKKAVEASSKKSKGIAKAAKTAMPGAAAVPSAPVKTSAPTAAPTPEMSEVTVAGAAAAAAAAAEAINAPLDAIKESVASASMAVIRGATAADAAKAAAAALEDAMPSPREMALKVVAMVASAANETGCLPADIQVAVAITAAQSIRERGGTVEEAADLAGECARMQGATPPTIAKLAAAAAATHALASGMSELETIQSAMAAADRAGGSSFDIAKAGLAAARLIVEGRTDNNALFEGDGVAGLNIVDLVLAAGGPPAEICKSYTATKMEEFDLNSSTAEEAIASAKHAAITAKGGRSDIAWAAGYAAAQKAMIDGELSIDVAHNAASATAAAGGTRWDVCAMAGRAATDAALREGYSTDQISLAAANAARAAGATELDIAKVAGLAIAEVYYNRGLATQSMFEAMASAARTALSSVGTVLAAFALSGTREIEVSSVAGFSVGDLIRVGDFEEVTVASFNSGLVLSTPLAGSYPVGTRVMRKLRAVDRTTTSSSSTSTTQTTSTATTMTTTTTLRPEEPKFASGDFKLKVDAGIVDLLKADPITSASMRLAVTRVAHIRSKFVVVDVGGPGSSKIIDANGKVPLAVAVFVEAQDSRSLAIILKQLQETSEAKLTAAFVDEYAKLSQFYEGDHVPITTKTVELVDKAFNAPGEIEHVLRTLPHLDSHFGSQGSRPYAWRLQREVGAPEKKNAKETQGEKLKLPSRSHSFIVNIVVLTTLPLALVLSAACFMQAWARF